MKTLIQLLLVALIFGGLSAAGTVFLTPPATAPTLAGASTTAAIPAPSGDIAANAGTSHDEQVSQTPIPTADEHPSTAEPPPFESHASLPTHSLSEPPVAIRPPYAPEGDEAGALINALRDRARLAQQSERRLADRQNAMELIFDDLRAEQANTLKLRMRIAQELDDAKRAVDSARKSIEDERAGLQREQDEARRAAEATVPAPMDERNKQSQPLEKTTRADSVPPDAPATIDTGGLPEENANLKKLAEIVDGMPAENVAKICEQLVKNNRRDSVVLLLNSMKGRQAAKVLAALTETDPELGAELTDCLKRLKPRATTASPPTE